MSDVQHDDNGNEASRKPMEVLKKEEERKSPDATQQQQAEEEEQNLLQNKDDSGAATNSSSCLPSSEVCKVDKSTAPSMPPQNTSKNQLRRKRKFERAMEIKRQKKEQQMRIKIAKAEAAGRDRDAERKEMEENRKDGKGWAIRNDKWNEKFIKFSSKYQVCLDCSYEEMMTPKEVNSLSLQIRYCYASNKRAKHPVTATVANLNGKTFENLENVSGSDQWYHRAFHFNKKPLLDAFPPDQKSNLVYLTSDSDNVLETLEDDKIYVIGGIVDRNRLKRAAISRAEEYGIQTAKLPIENYLSMVSTKVLTCNHVFDILLKYREHGNDWKKALLDVLPERKDAKAKG